MHQLCEVSSKEEINFMRIIFLKRYGNSRNGGNCLAQLREINFAAWSRFFIRRLPQLWAL